MLRRYKPVRWGDIFFTGVPDSLLKSFCAHVMDKCGANEVVRRSALTIGVCPHKTMQNCGECELKHGMQAENSGENAVCR